MEQFNKLTPAEHERLALLAEECAEVIAVIGKILRHGFESYNPDKPEDGSNREQLEKELGDVEYVFEKLVEHEDVRRGKIAHHACMASIKKPRYLHHQSECSEPEKGR